jgi:hypothetical protein
MLDTKEETAWFARLYSSESHEYQLNHYLRCIRRCLEQLKTPNQHPPRTRWLQNTVRQHSVLCMRLKSIISPACPDNRIGGSLLQHEVCMLMTELVAMGRGF